MQVGLGSGVEGQQYPGDIFNPIGARKTCAEGSLEGVMQPLDNPVGLQVVGRHVVNLHPERGNHVSPCG